ncbi:putative transferase, protein kinase RLK-Pelle-LRR-XI-1 family [Helianthus annuus]|nr:putative transferase, protein kinase RLK-Pelle-LRR-XI-1 family [Helianthus annuus]
MTSPPPPPPPPHLHLISIILLLTITVTSQTFSTSEQTTLLNLKRTWGNPPSLTNWNSTTSPCTWPEVHCRHNWVVGLQLNSKNLTGLIPGFICDLRNLENVILRDNFLTGEFPRVFYNCSKVVELDISQNLFVGRLPDDIDRLSRLETLELGANNFTGDIPPAIGKLSELRLLHLYQNLFNGSIPPEIGNLSKLEVLGLAYNDFPDPEIPLEFGRLKNLKTLWMAATNLVASALVLLAAVMSTLFVFRDRVKKQPKRTRTIWKLTSFQKMDFTEANILSCMTEANVIGIGGAGKVYRIGVGQPRGYVAVKRIWNKLLDQSQENEFTSEVLILGSIRHSNIVKLLCCLSSQNSELLVYEYMVHQSLDRWLHGKKRKLEPGSVPGFVLDWPRRLQIAIGAAQGLCYMHHDCSPPIVHRDVKSSNILLDSEFKAKIADFGLAKFLEKQKPGEDDMSSIVGSLGYFAPEYAYTSRINERIDVYSFGVVLLELVTGKEANEGDEDLNLAEWAWKHYEEGGSMMGALDLEIKDPDTYMEEISTVFKLGLICTSTLPSSRPSMKDVLEILKRCNPLDLLPEEVKHGREEFAVAPLLRRESYVTSYH